MKIFFNCVKAILNNKIVINSIGKDSALFLKGLGARKRIFNKDIWDLRCDSSNKEELAKKLEKLRDFGFVFVGAPAGWPPAAVFDFLRKDGYVTGKIIEIMWNDSGQVTKREI